MTSYKPLVQQQQRQSLASYLSCLVHYNTEADQFDGPPPKNTELLSM